MPSEISQQQFLQSARHRLGLTWGEFADRLGTPRATLAKWAAPATSRSNYRPMPPNIWSQVREVLAHEALKASYNPQHNPNKVN